MIDLSNDFCATGHISNLAVYLMPILSNAAGFAIAWIARTPRKG